MSYIVCGCGVPGLVDLTFLIALGHSLVTGDVPGGNQGLKQRLPLDKAPFALFQRCGTAPLLEEPLSCTVTSGSCLAYP